MTGRSNSALSARAVVLAMLHRGKPLYGLEILRLCRDATDGLFVPHQGNLYPTLEDMCERGFIKVSSVESRGPDYGGRPKVRYRLTPKGRREAEKLRTAVINLFDVDAA